MDGQPSQGVGLELCVPYAWRRAQYGHSASASRATIISFASLFTVFSTNVVHHSLLGASVVLQYMYLCIELCIRGWTYICKHGWIWNKWLPTFKFKTCDFLIRDYTAHGLWKQNVFNKRRDQTRFLDPLHVRSISTAHMISQEKTCAINNNIAHSSFLLNVCDSHLITHASKLLTVCNVVRIANVWS